MLDPLALAVYCYLIFLFSFCLWHRDMKMHLIIVFFLFFSLLPTYFCSFFFSFHSNEIVGHAKDWPSTRSSSEEKKKRKKKTQMFWRSYPLLLFALSVSCLEWCVFFLLCISRLIPARWRLCSQPHGQTIQIKKEQIHFYTWQELCISDVILCIVRRLSWRRNVNLGSTSRYFQYILKRKSTMTMTDNITNWKLSNRDMFYDVIRLIWSAIWRYEVETIAWLCWRQRATYPNSTCLDRAQ